MKCRLCDSEMTLQNPNYPHAHYWFCFKCGHLEMPPKVFERRGKSMAEVQDIMEKVMA